MFQVMDGLEQHRQPLVQMDGEDLRQRVIRRAIAEGVERGKKRALARQAASAGPPPAAVVAAPAAHTVEPSPPASAMKRRTTRRKGGGRSELLRAVDRINGEAKPAVDDGASADVTGSEASPGSGQAALLAAVDAYNEQFRLEGAAVDGTLASAVDRMNDAMERGEGQE